MAAQDSSPAVREVRADLSLELGGTWRKNRAVEFVEKRCYGFVLGQNLTLQFAGYGQPSEASASKKYQNGPSYRRFMVCSQEN